MKEYYFDYAATTPVDSQVFKEMEPYLRDKYGNPSSIYNKGQEARLAIEGAREKIANILGSDTSEIIFTSCATESNNLAIKGVYFSRYFKNQGNHIITSPIEHHSVLDTIKYLKDNFNADVTELPVSTAGIIDPEDVKKSIKDSTVLVSIMYANNEIGTIEPIEEIAYIIKDINKIREAKNLPPVYFHTDAVQGVQYLDSRVDKLGINFLSITGHKFYAPKGVGVLYVKRGSIFLPQQNGGGQEKHRRAGTENVANIVGIAKALELAIGKKTKEVERLRLLRDKLIEQVLNIPGSVLTGDNKKRLPHIASFVFKNVEGESLLLKLNTKGFYVSTGSACASGSLQPSHVLTAVGLKPEMTHSSIRISMGQYTTEDDVNAFVKILPDIIDDLRGISSGVLEND